jgi:hypothetical protein
LTKLLTHGEKPKIIEIYMNLRRVGPVRIFDASALHLPLTISNVFWNLSQFELYFSVPPQALFLFVDPWHLVKSINSSHVLGIRLPSWSYWRFSPIGRLSKGQELIQINKDLMAKTTGLKLQVETTMFVSCATRSTGSSLSTPPMYWA